MCRGSLAVAWFPRAVPLQVPLSSWRDSVACCGPTRRPGAALGAASFRGSVQRTFVVSVEPKERDLKLTPQRGDVAIGFLAQSGHNTAHDAAELADLGVQA